MDDFLSVIDLWRICLSHWRWFVVTVVLTLGAAAYYLSVTPDLFTREAAILVRQETKGNNTGHGLHGEEFNSIGLVQPVSNVENVRRELTSLKVLSEVMRHLSPKLGYEESVRRAEALRKNLKATIENDKSTIINLTCTAPSTHEAEQVLNLLVQVYNELSLWEKTQVAKGASLFIEDRLRILKQELGIVDDSISAYKQTNRITDLEQANSIYLKQQSHSETEMLRLSNQLQMARYILDHLKQTRTNYQLLPTNSGINNVMAEAQIQQYNNMLLQLKKNLIGTSRQNPLIIKSETELDDLRRSIVATIENQVKTLDIQLQSLQGYNAETGSKISSSPNQAKQLVSIEREQKVKESLYLYLLQKKEENEISMTYNSAFTQLIDMPHGSDRPTAPNRAGIMVAALIMGLLLPVVVLFVKENLNNTVRDKHDIERHTRLALIGEVPFCAEARPRRRRLPHLWGSRRTATSRPLVVAPGRQDLINESFRFIRTNLEFMGTGKGERGIYVVTSAYPGSGKTFVSLNLALSLAIKGRRVLLIDGDLRHASASRKFGNADKGLADYLGEQTDDYRELLVHPEEYDQLDVLPVGTLPPNPTELLAGERLGRLLDTVSRAYEFVLIDCPPNNTLADTGIISRHADRTLFIIRAGLFVRARLSDLEEEVENGRYKHLSIILNATPASNLYGYRYGRGRGYQGDYPYLA